MKKIILSVLILSMTLAINAQNIPERKSGKPGMHHNMDRKRGLHMDMQKLNLTEDQKAKFKTQKESFKKQMEELKKNDNVTVKEWRIKMESLRKENKAEMESILTADQKNQIEVMKKEKKQQHEEMAKKRGDKMHSFLGLTDAQKVQLDKNKADIQSKMKAIKEDKSLTDQQKKERVMDLRKSQKENMKSILTEEQIKKLKEPKQRKHGGPDGERKKPMRKETV